MQITSSSRPAREELSSTETEERDIVEMARDARRSAGRFAEAVRRYGDEMPAALDRFHHAMGDFRETARRLRLGLPLDREGTQ